MKTFSLFALITLSSLFAFGQTPTPLSIDLTIYISGGISDPVGIEFVGNLEKLKWQKTVLFLQVLI